MADLNKKNPSVTEDALAIHLDSSGNIDGISGHGIAGTGGGGGVNYTAGKYIDISENIISVSGLEPYSAGQNIDITDNVISGKDWSNAIKNASSYVYEQATAHGVEYSGIAPIDVNNTTHQISADVWTLSGRNGISILEDDVNKITTIDLTGITANSTGLIANCLTANNKGFSAGGISASNIGSGNTPLCIQGCAESIYAPVGRGFVFSSLNTAVGTARLSYAYGNEIVQTDSPKFEARNPSGAGFSIEASGAKGYDHNGNITWDTTVTPAPNSLVGYADTKASTGDLNGNIVLTVVPKSYQGSLSAIPHTLIDGNGITASYGSTAETPNIRITPGSITLQSLYGNNTASASMDFYNVKYENSAGTWSLTNSIQKREIEGDSATSAITAIAGSAIGGIAGDIIDLSAGEGISIVETADKVLISNNISAGSNMSFVYDSETNKIRIDANDAFPITATDGNTTWSADCKASAFTIARNTSRTDIGAFGFEYSQAPSVNVSGTWYDLALLMEKFKYAIPVETVANSGLATGQNILYVVTGS